LKKVKDKGKKQLSSEKEQRIIEAIKRFNTELDKRINEITVKKLIDEGGINPYLVKSLGFKTIDDTVELFLTRHIIQGLGGSFGAVLERFIIELTDGQSGRECEKKGLEKPWISWWDVVIKKSFIKDKKNWKGIVISVKSGPQNMNNDQVKHFVRQAKKAEKHGYRPCLVFVYGKTAWGVISNTLPKKGYDPKEYVLIGKQVFNKFLKDHDYYKRALELFQKGWVNTNIFKSIDKKKRAMVAELKKKYGNDLEKLLQDTF